VKKSLVVGKYAAEVGQAQNTAGSSKAQKVAAFDLDDTLITPSVGNKWARSPSGWRWWHNTVPTKLKQLDAEGFRVIFLSNQGTISLKDNPKALQKDSISLINFKSQLTAILQQLDLPISVYAATGQDRYRKPRTGMWQEMLEDFELDEPGKVDMNASFYVGDAAGREKIANRPKDHACSDR
jgi:bifunctional polynucleotide phosphatase/kinase